jgi:ribosomal protein S18 acetylase RimI-like enzyme
MIKKATSKDLKEIMSLIKLNGDTFSKFEIPAAEKSIREFVKKQDKNNKFFVIVESGKTIGCGGYAKNDDTYGVYTLCWLVIHPDFKRQGKAIKLYDHIESDISSLRARLIIAEAGRDEINRFFYRKIKFKTAGIIPKYYSEKEDLVWYCKKII